MTEPLPAQFDPHAIETPLYTWWAAQALFTTTPDTPGDPYVIQMPPPNVTAVLHAGHGLNNTVQDVLIRFERMRGRKALWIPGTDHAGIATQNVVERLLAQRGQTRFDVGRDAFIEHVRQFVAETGGAILEQLKALGASCDWSRTYYTLDPALSRAVREVFVRLYDKGLIYRGKYIVNWCPRCLTTLANEEVEKEERDGQLWRLRYPIADSDQFVIVATTRPETMLGDTGIAVHPGDARYQGWIGRTVRLPLTDRLIPIVADDAVDPEFGSGAVKVTPAHDLLDFDIGRRAGLASIDIFTPDARTNDNVPPAFRDLDRNDARERVVAAMQALGLLDGVQPHRHAVGHCYRCGTVVEPRLSDQWFVNVRPMADRAIAAQRAGDFRIIPEHHHDVLLRWHENLRDWCISRQLWWGHRIPVWYCEGATERGREGDKPGCGKLIVAREDPPACPDCGGALRQDEDVLDTWFSSWLVPFSTLGWPDQTADLAAFYPGTTLVTAPEILFLWVSRMIMSGLEFMGAVPFRTIYLHGTVRDTQHRKMSKSLGNGIDPLEVIDRFGADALRYTMVSGMSVGTDLILDPADLDMSFAPGRHFANKLWNIGRFLLTHLESGAPELAAVDAGTLTLADRWMLTRLNQAVDAATDDYQRFRLNEAAATVYHFLWSDLADWYVEQVKPRLYGTQSGGDTARAVAAHVFDAGLRLLHPIMPFITEALWQRLPNHPAGAALMTARWPAPVPVAEATRALEEFDAVQRVVTAVRTLRAEYAVGPGQTINVSLADATPLVRRALDAEADTIRRLARIGELGLLHHGDRAGATSVLADGTVVIVPLGDLIDVDKECGRLGSEIARLDAGIAALASRLANAEFTTRAPAAIVARERDKLDGWRGQLAALRDKRRALGCAD